MPAPWAVQRHPKVDSFCVPIVPLSDTKQTAEAIASWLNHLAPSAVSHQINGERDFVITVSQHAQKSVFNFTLQASLHEPGRDRSTV